MQKEIEVTLRPDSKGRISLSKLSPAGVTSYRGHWDKKHNSIVLKPYIDVPAEEAWIFENPEALKKLKKGLNESKKGQVKYLGSFAKHMKD
jgi:hypothetical protein